MKKTMFRIIGLMAILAAMVTGLNAQVDTLLNQNFEGTTFPPTNWNQIINNTGNTSGNPRTWYRLEDYGANYHNGNAGACCWWESSGQPIQDEWLITPDLDLSEYDPLTDIVTLRFVSAFYHSATSCNQHDYVCLTTNGQTWIDTLDDLAKNYGNPSTWVYVPDNPNPMTYDLTSYIGNSIRIGFNYYFTTGSGKGIWTVDDVMLYVSTSGGGGGELDLELASVVRPNTVEEGDVPFAPACKIFNNTTDTVIAEVLCRITDLDEMQVKYERVLSNFPIYPGYTTADGFADFTPEGSKEYKVLFVVTNEDDINESNNNLEKHWSTLVAENVTPTEILAPTESQLNAFSPSAKFLEKAGVDEPGVFLHYKIEGTSMEDSISHDFSADEEYTATFAEVSGLENSSFTITFWATNPQGTEISKPALSRDFTYIGAAEKPEVAKFELSVSGQNVVFSLAKSTRVSLKVYDAAGNLVATLANGTLSAGTHQMTMSTVPGVYFVKLVTPEYTAVRKALTIK